MKWSRQWHFNSSLANWANLALQLIWRPQQAPHINSQHGLSERDIVTYVRASFFQKVLSETDRKLALFNHLAHVEHPDRVGKLFSGYFLGWELILIFFLKYHFYCWHSEYQSLIMSVKGAYRLPGPNGLTTPEIWALCKLSWIPGTCFTTLSDTLKSTFHHQIMALHFHGRNQHLSSCGILLC